MDHRGAQHVSITRSDDKCQITLLFAITKSDSVVKTHEAMTDKEALTRKGFEKKKNRTSLPTFYSISSLSLCVINASLSR